MLYPDLTVKEIVPVNSYRVEWHEYVADRVANEIGMIGYAIFEGYLPQNFIEAERELDNVLSTFYEGGLSSFWGDSSDLENEEDAKNVSAEFKAAEKVVALWGKIISVQGLCLVPDGMKKFTQGFKVFCFPECEEHQLLEIKVDKSEERKPIANIVIDYTGFSLRNKVYEEKHINVLLQRLTEINPNNHVWVEYVN